MCIRDSDGIPLLFGLHFFLVTFPFDEVPDTCDARPHNCRACGSVFQGIISPVMDTLLCRSIELFSDCLRFYELTGTKTLGRDECIIPLTFNADSH